MPNPRYIHSNRELVAKALETIRDTLTATLKTTIESTDISDSLESARVMNALLNGGATEDALHQEVNVRRDRTAQTIGHLQKRIAEVQYLVQQFSSETCPDQNVLRTTYDTLMQCVVYETLLVCELHKRRPKAWRKQSRARIEVYYSALRFAFSVSPNMNWSLFPYDKS